MKLQKVLAGVMVATLALTGIPVEGLQIESAKAEETVPEERSPIYTIADLHGINSNMDGQVVTHNASEFGLIYEVQNGGAVITGCDENATVVNIPDRIDGYVVWSIAERAFYNKQNLTEVTIPASVTKINKGAFRDCTGLKTVKIYSENLGDADYYSSWSGNCADHSIFYNAGSMDGMTVSFESGVTRIPAYLFATGNEMSDNVYCRISSVSIADSVKEIGKSAFEKCYDLNEITSGGKPEIIDNYAFNNTALRSYDVPETVVSIGEGAFSSIESLTSVTIPASVTKINKGAFRDCTGLKTVKIYSKNLGDADYYSSWSGNCADHSIFYNAGSMDGMTVSFESGVTRIPAYLFATGNEMSDNVYCRISSVSIANSVKEIGKSAFEKCYDLNEITSGGKPEIIDNYAFCNTAIISYDVPETVVSIGEGAFRSIESLTEVTIPASVTKINKGAFRDCTGLKTVKIYSKNLGDADYYSNWSGNCADYSIFYNAGSMDGMTVSFESGVTRIPAYLFATGNEMSDNVYCRISSVSIADSVKEIGKSAFEKCYKLKKITFMKDSPTFGENAFYNVTATGYYPTGNNTWGPDVCLDYGGEITWMSYDPGSTPDPEPGQDIAVESVSLNTTSIGMKVGDTKSLTATIKPTTATNKSVTWKSDDTNVAEVSDKGVVTAKGEGTTKITVTTVDGNKTASCNVKVSNESEPEPEPEEVSIAVAPTSVNIKVGETAEIAAAVTPADAKVTWTSSDDSVATVYDGTITGISAGNATVTASCGNAKATVDVTVEDDDYSYDKVIHVGGRTTIKYKKKVTKIFNYDKSVVKVKKKGKKIIIIGKSKGIAGISVYSKKKLIDFVNVKVE